MVLSGRRLWPGINRIFCLEMLKIYAPCLPAVLAEDSRAHTTVQLQELTPDTPGGPCSEHLPGEPSMLIGGLWPVWWWWGGLLKNHSGHWWRGEEGMSPRGQGLGIRLLHAGVAIGSLARACLLALSRTWLGLQAFVRK